MTTAHATAAAQADYARKIGSLIDGKETAAVGQVVAAGEMLAKHLRTAPAGTTIRDLIENS